MSSELFSRYSTSISFCLDQALTSKTQSLHFFIKSSSIDLSQVEAIIISDFQISFFQISYQLFLASFSFFLSMS